MNFSRSGSGARNNGGLVKSYDLDRTLVVRERESGWVPCEGQQGPTQARDRQTDIQTHTGLRVQTSK